MDLAFKNPVHEVFLRAPVILRRQFELEKGVTEITLLNSGRFFCELVINCVQKGSTLLYR